MVDLDNPFDRRNDWFHRYRTRSDTEFLPSNMDQWLKGIYSNKSISTKAGWFQNTIDPGPTLFHSLRRIIQDPKAHPISRRVARNIDEGGSFHSRQRVITRLPNYEKWRGGPNADNCTVFDGYRWPCQDSRSFANGSWFNSISDTPFATFSELWSWGGVGLARAAPTIPRSDFLVAMGELRNGLPTIPGRTVRKGKLSLGSLSSEYLNYIFGIVPTINDSQSIARVAAKADHLLELLRKDQGKRIRRRFLLDESQSSVILKTHRAPQQPIPYLYHDPDGNATRTCTHTTTTSMRVWFTGTFTYSFPGVEKKLAELQEFNHLYGTTPSADSLWNLNHWTWLIDWFVTTSSLMTNLSTYGQGGVRIHHSYIMIEKRKDLIYDCGVNSVAFTETSRHRLKASPFGFGVKPGSLNNKQKAILTALGLSRWS